MSMTLNEDTRAAVAEEMVDETIDEINKRRITDLQVRLYNTQVQLQETERYCERLERKAKRQRTELRRFNRFHNAGLLREQLQRLQVDYWEQQDQHKVGNNPWWRFW